MIAPLKKYEQRKTRYNLLLKKQQKFINNISTLRLAIFILGLVISIRTYISGKYHLFISECLCIFILFAYLSYLHNNMKSKKIYTSALQEINEASIKRLKGDWKLFEDIGEEFIDKAHNYSYDLDIFGKHSIFQWLNTTYTYIGRKKLKEILTEKPQNKQTIYNRQAAVNELSKKISFRQRLEAEGKTNGNNRQSPKELFLWLKETNNNILKKPVIWFIRIFSTITTITTLILVIRIIDYLMSYIFDIDKSAPKLFYLIPYYVPFFLIIIQCIILRINKENRIKNLIIAEKYNNNIKVYGNMLRHIEKQKFISKYIMDLCDKLYDNAGQSASKKTYEFSKICEAIANRRGVLYPTLNSILMLEYHWTISIEKWKLKSSNDLEIWLNTIGELEALSSIAIIKYDNPNWTIAKIATDSSKIIAKNMGHPLLGEKRVCNDLKVEEPYSVMLITGSNMSGKSTFMRSLGVNIILAYAGAPVCADEFYCTIMDLYSCMRVSDDLGQSISSFHAEILKIKNIVKASEEGNQILFLLDEIFKGTNSIDRHTGAMILIEQLSKSGNIGFVSTHDLELGEMEKHRDSKIKNYHFSEYYVDNKIYFDYKLKPGVSTTRNALYLMKLAGIEI